ncbi:helix-turn-helix domain-containing protein [Pseudomonas aeruginosa]
MRCPTVTKAPPHPSYLICILYIFLQFTQLILHNMRMKHIMSKTHMGVMRMFTTPLRKARLNAKMTIQEVAASIKCDPGNLSRMERGIQRPSPEVAEKLAKLFSTELTEIQILYPERFCADANHV